MSETWQVFKIEELESLSFRCAQCGTEIVFHAGADIVSQQERLCPGCNKEIPDAGPLLKMYRELFRQGKGKLVLRARGDR